MFVAKIAGRFFCSTPAGKNVEPLVGPSILRPLGHKYLVSSTLVLGWAEFQPKQVLHHEDLKGARSFDKN
jgi:hypothetical protein